MQAQSEAATRRQNLAAAEATAQTAELALKRYIVSGTDDPLWLPDDSPGRPALAAPPPTDIDGAVRKALTERTDVLSAQEEPGLATTSACGTSRTSRGRRST